MIQDAAGDLISSGLPLATVEKNTVQVPLWSRNAHVTEAHGLTGTPDLVAVRAVFVANRLDIGWTAGESCQIALGGVGDATNLSAIVVDLTSADFTVINSCASADALMIPDKTSGTNAPGVVDATDVRLDFTFMKITV